MVVKEAVGAGTHRILCNHWCHPLAMVVKKAVGVSIYCVLSNQWYHSAQFICWPGIPIYAKEAKDITDQIWPYLRNDVNQETLPLCISLAVGTGRCNLVANNSQDFLFQLVSFIMINRLPSGHHIHVRHQLNGTRCTAPAITVSTGQSGLQLPVPRHIEGHVITMGSHGHNVSTTIINGFHSW